MFLFHFDTWILGFQHPKSLYPTDIDFREIYSDCLKHTKGDFLIQEGYSFKGTRLCIPKCDTCELLIREIQGGSLIGHYGENKTLIMLREKLFLAYTE